MTSLFVYGSLMSPRVLACVIGHSHENTKKSTLQGFHRYCIKERSYPALCPANSSDDAVHGILVIGLSDKDIQALDDFEGSDYIRKPIRVRISGEEKEVDAYTYIWVNGSSDPLLYGTWSFEKDFLPREEETLLGWGFI